MNWSKARDWEVVEGANKGHDKAIVEAKRRGLDTSSKPNPVTGSGYWSKPQ